MDPTPAGDVVDRVESEVAARSDLAVISNEPVVRFETDHGTIDVLLYTTWMPEHGQRILQLVHDGFYDGVQFHRVIPGFVIQSGDPTGTGTGGSGQTIPHEFDERLQYLSGGMGMARGSDLDSADSQWFFTTHPATRMSNPDGEYAAQYGTYAMFGQVVRGLDVVRTISEVTTIPQQDRPVVPVLVQSATVIENDVDPTAYPLQPIEVGGHVVSMPLHQFAGHPFAMTQEVNGPDALAVACSHEGDALPVAPLHFEEPEILTWPAGVVDCTFTAGDEVLEQTFVVGAAP